MTEFVLNTDGAGAPWHGLDAFTQGFIEAAFFSETSCFDSSEFFTDEAQERISEGQADGEIPNDASVSDIDVDSFAKVKNYCDKFQSDNAELLQEAYAARDGLNGEYDEVQAGRDLYFTHAGHGVGYWDRGLGDIGDKLSTAAGRGEINLSAYQSDAHESGFLIEIAIW